MNNFIVYLLESGLCLLVFFILYQLLLKRETFYRLNRVFLLSSLIFSLVIPLLNVSIGTTASAPVTNFQMEPILVSATRGAVITTKRLGVFEIIGILYFLMVLIMVARLVSNIRVINRLFSVGRIIKHDQYRLILHSSSYPPFSFFRYIFLNESQYSGKELDEIIEHEKAHIRQLHSVDLVIAEILRILQWFNPMAWYFKNLVTENHEFLADEAVINRGFSPESYQLRILTQLFGIRSMPAVHNFNQSVTQKRLRMMGKSKSPAVSRLKMILALPLAIMLFYLFACSADTGTNDMPEKATTLEPDGSEYIYIKVDVPAEPDGGLMAFRKDLASRILYPEEARKKGIQGKVYIQFIVDENGKIVKAIEDSQVPPPPPPPEKASTEEPPPPPPVPEKVVLEGIVVAGFRQFEGDETEFSREEIQLLADEAIRVIVESDIRWKPAMKDGKPVRSAWTLPITFILQ